MGGVDATTSAVIAAAVLLLTAPAGAPTREADAAAPPPQQFAPEISEGPDVLSFEQDERGRMTVPVSVGGHGPFPFLVDTGSERTVISSELARRLSLAPGPTVTLHSMTDVRRVRTAVIPKLGVSQQIMDDVHAPALEGQNIGAAGMLGVDSLQSQRVLFDFKNKTMSITPARKEEKYWGPDAIVITGRSLFGRLILTNARIDGQRIIVVLDTGSQVSIGNEALRRKLTARNRLARTVPIEITSVTGARMTADYTAVREVHISGIRITDIPIAFADALPFRQLELMDQPALLLGMDILQLFDRVSVDFARRQIRFLAPNASPRMIQERLAGSGGSGRKPGHSARNASAEPYPTTQVRALAVGRSKA